MQDKLKGSATAALLVGAAVALAGCGTTSTAAPTHGVPWSGYNKEFLDEAHRLPLPPEAAWQTKASGASLGPDGRRVNYEAGTGRSDADYYWWCSWSKNWLKTHESDPSAASRALAQLDTITGTPLYQHGTLPSERHYFTDELQRAKLGDAVLLQNDVHANCQPPA